jgi:hypothetical protein
MFLSMYYGGGGGIGGVIGSDSHLIVKDIYSE